MKRNEILGLVTGLVVLAMTFGAMYFSGSPMRSDTGFMIFTVGCGAAIFATFCAGDLSK